MGEIFSIRIHFVSNLVQEQPQTSQETFIQLGKAVIALEAKAVSALASRIDKHFTHACNLLLQCNGRVVVIGMGKSGHIGSKIAATLASTGTPAFFVHPGEASHGDLGMITTKDVVLAISNSGETSEIKALLPFIKRYNIPLISLTGQKSSTIASVATANIDVSVAQEACPLGLAPTSSTTATLAMGDALAVALLKARGFTEDDFALSHPGGRLGRRLLLHIDDLLLQGDAMPMVAKKTTLSNALIEITQKGLGMTVVVDDNQRLAGIFTDGDLRRAVDAKHDLHYIPIEQAMSVNPKTVKLGLLAVDALTIMEQHKITTLVVIDGEDYPIGIVRMQDIISAGVV